MFAVYVVLVATLLVLLILLVFVIKKRQNRLRAIAQQPIETALIQSDIVQPEQNPLPKIKKLLSPKLKKEPKQSIEQDVQDVQDPQDEQIEPLGSQNTMRFVEIRFEPNFINPYLGVGNQQTPVLQWLMPEHLRQTIITQTNQTNQTNQTKPTKRNKQTPINKHFKELETHTSDSQNVHTPEINKLLQLKYKRLLEVNDFAKDADNNIWDDIRAATINEISIQSANYIDNDPKLTKNQKHIRKRRIEMVLNKIRQGNTLTSLSLINPPREDDILANVWIRIHNDQNKDNQKQMQIAMYDALLDSAPKKTESHLFIDLLVPVISTTEPNDPISRKYTPVCINGRVARVLGTLTLLDADPSLSTTEKDFSEISNEAYTKSMKIYDDAFTNYHIPNIHELYSKQESELTESELNDVKQFEIYIKDKIRDELTKDYKNILTEDKLEELIKKAQSAI
jgi:heme exporter protein D